MAGYDSDVEHRQQAHAVAALATPVVACTRHSILLMLGLCACCSYYHWVAPTEEYCMQLMGSGPKSVPDA